MIYGRDDLMVMAAVRYCIGRQTYIVSDCVDWLTCVWPDLSESIKTVIRRDIEDAWERDNNARSHLLSRGGDDFDGSLPLGNLVDRREWERAMLLWAGNAVPHDLEQT